MLWQIFQGRQQAKRGRPDLPYPVCREVPRLGPYRRGRPHAGEKQQGGQQVHRGPVAGQE